jgi:hypothetical protein
LERSSSEPVVLFDRVLLAGMAIGAWLMLQPVWGEGLRWGFFLTLACTVLEIVTGHLVPEEPE